MSGNDLYEKTVQALTELLCSYADPPTKEGFAYALGEQPESVAEGILDSGLVVPGAMPPVYRNSPPTGDFYEDDEPVEDVRDAFDHSRQDATTAFNGNARVAYNMTQARLNMRLSQEEVAKRLTRVTGHRWTNATVSAAERSWRGKRTRRFDANDLAALAFVFNRPVAYFFTSIPSYELEAADG